MSNIYAKLLPEALFRIMRVGMDIRQAGRKQGGRNKNGTDKEEDKDRATG